MLTPESGALRRIYDAASDPGAWPEALDALTEATGCASAILAVRDLTAGSIADGGPYEFSAGSRLVRDEATAIEEYSARFADYERAEFDRLRDAPVREVVSDAFVWPDVKAVRERDDYRFRRERFGVYRRLAVRLDDDRRRVDLAFFQLGLEHDDVPAPIRAAVGGFVPHIAKSVELGRTFVELRRRFDDVLGALDRVRIGICLVRADGTVVRINEEGRRIVDGTSEMSITPRGRVAFANDRVAASVLAAIEATVRTAGGADGVREFRTSAGKGADGPRLLIEVAPLRDATAELGGRREHALLTLIDPRRTEHVSTERLSIAHGLSASESEVCRLLVAGRTRTEIAEARGVGPETVKTQSRSIARKTGVASRVELVRLALRTSPPIGG